MELLAGAHGRGCARSAEGPRRVRRPAAGAVLCFAKCRRMVWLLNAVHHM